MVYLTWAIKFLTACFAGVLNIFWRIVDSLDAYGTILSMILSVISFRFFVKPMLGGSDIAVASKKSKNSDNGGKSNKSEE